MDSTSPAKIPYKLEHTTSGKPYIHLQTSSKTPIYLTEVRLYDAPAMAATGSHPSIANAISAIPQPYTVSEASSFITSQLSGSPAELPLQVLRSGDPTTGTFIGVCSLRSSKTATLMYGEKKGCELAYYLHPDWRGKGIMRQSIRALVWWGREVEGVQVMVRAWDENRGSVGVIESFEEFVREDEFDGWVDWPEDRGGGRRRNLAWRWVG